MSGNSSWRTRIRSVFRGIVFYSLIIIVGSVAGNLWMTRNQASGAAPQLSGISLDGSPLHINYASFERPVLVYFFAEWCPICKIQNAAISSINEDFAVVAVAMQSGDVDNVKQYLDAEGLAVVTINDEFGGISRDFSVTGVPAVFVIDDQGIIRASLRGYASEWGMRLRLWLIEKGWL